MARFGHNRILYIAGPIAGDAADDYITTLNHWELRPGDEGGDVTILLNSPGGSVMDGLALYDTIQRMRRKGHHFTIRGQGLVASMAVVVLQAADHRIADANAQFLLHELSAGTSGKVSGLQDETRAVGRLNKRLFSILASRAKVSERTLKAKASRKEWWIDAEEAFKLGLVDAIE